MVILKKNTVHHMDFSEGALLIPEKSVQLIIFDPPYFEVMGDFDFIWDSMANYLEDVEKWAVSCKRILADNGSLYVYGHALKIAYVQMIFDKYFNLENNLVWNKKECQTRRGVENYRKFAPVTERILFYSNEIERTGLEEIKLDINNFKPLRDYFQKVQEFTGKTKTAIIEIIGQQADHCFRWGSSQWDMPTPETYGQLIHVLGIDKMCGFEQYESLRLQYESLRLQYESLRRTWSNPWRHTDVLEYSQEAHITKNYDFPTKKPETLTRMLILASSTKGGLVVVPCAGSGTECAMALKEGREFIAFDIDIKAVNMSNERVAEISRMRSQTQLFYPPPTL